LLKIIFTTFFLFFITIKSIYPNKIQQECQDLAGFPDEHKSYIWISDLIQFEEAEKVCKSFLELFPNSALANFNYARVLYSIDEYRTKPKNFDQYFSYLEKSLELGGTDGAYTHIIQLYRDGSLDFYGEEGVPADIDKAIYYAQQGSDKGFGNALDFLAEFYFSEEIQTNNKKELMIKYYQKASELFVLNSTFSLLDIEFGITRSLEQITKALEERQRYVDQFGIYDSRVMEFNEKLAYQLLTFGDYPGVRELASEYIEIANKISPPNRAHEFTYIDYIYYLIGQSYYYEQNYGEVIKNTNIAIKLSTSDKQTIDFYNSEYYMALADTYDILGQKDKAIELALLINNFFIKNKENMSSSEDFRFFMNNSAQLASYYKSNYNKAKKYWKLSDEAYEQYKKVYESEWHKPPKDNRPEYFPARVSHLIAIKANKDEIEKFIFNYIENEEGNALAAGYKSMAELYLYYEDDEQCIKWGEKAKNLIKKTFKDIDALDQEFEGIYSLLSDCYWNIGDMKNAYKFANKEIQIYKLFRDKQYEITKVEHDFYSRRIQNLFDIIFRNYEEIGLSEQMSSDLLFELIQLSRESLTSKSISLSALKNKITDKRFQKLISKKEELIYLITSDQEKLFSIRTAVTIDRNNELNLIDKVDINEKELKLIETKIEIEFPNSVKYLGDHFFNISEIQNKLKHNEGVMVISTSEAEETSPFSITYLTSDASEFAVSSFEKKEDFQKLVKKFNAKIENPKYNVRNIREAFDIYKELFLIEDKEVFNKNISKIYIIYDSYFSKIPFSALMYENPKKKMFEKDVKWLANKYAFNYLPSLSSFMFLKDTEINKNEVKLIGFANPSFNNSNNNIKISKLIANNTLRSSMNFEQISLLPSLPNTEDELKAFAKIFNKEETILFFGSDASEDNVKNISLKSDYLLFSTHALIPDEIDDLNEHSIVLSPPGTISQSNNGVLTTSEIINLKLNTKLVILSACNTAYGDSYYSEGLTGLANAFFYAGAKNLIVSNWSVETFSTELLMRHLSKNLKTIDISQSLQLAKLSLIESKEYNHPFFWSAFILAGTN
jgi:CHAT domain-containing protein